MPVKPGRKAIYHLPVVFGTLFFLPPEYLFVVYISKLVMVDDKERGTNWIYPYEKNSDLVYNLLSDKLYLSPP